MSKVTIDIPEEIIQAKLREYIETIEVNKDADYFVTIPCIGKDGIRRKYSVAMLKQSLDFNKDKDDYKKKRRDIIEALLRDIDKRVACIRYMLDLELEINESL